MLTRRRIPTALFILFCATWQTWGQTIIKPENERLTLTGVIRKIHGFVCRDTAKIRGGTRIIYWALDLSANVACTPEKPEWAEKDSRSVKRLHMFFPSYPADNGLELKAQFANGKTMAVTGVLHSQHRW